MLISRQIYTNIQLVLHSVSTSEWKMDNILPVMWICVQRELGTDTVVMTITQICIPALRLSLHPDSPLMTSTDSPSQEHVLWFTASLKQPLVCLKIFTCVQIWTKSRELLSKMHCLLEICRKHIFYSAFTKLLGFNRSCGMRLTSAWV